MTRSDHARPALPMPPAAIVAAIAALVVGCSTTPDNNLGGYVPTDTAVDTGGVSFDTGSGGADAAGADDTAATDDAASADDTASAEDSGGAFDNGVHGAWLACPPAPSDSGTTEFGKPCSEDSECLYGVCLRGGPVVDYKDDIGFCTKNCGCGAGETTPCAFDAPEQSTTYFQCVFEKTANSGNPNRDPSRDVMKMCLKSCKTDDDCAAWNPALPFCRKSSNKTLSVGTIGVCVRSSGD